jgi:uncharacterized membrane protein YedE/YeeE
MSYTLSFTPYTALAGGALLGVATVGKLALSGRVLGVSGAFKGLVRGSLEPWRLAFVGGLIAAGALARDVGVYDETMSRAMVGAGRAVCAGALVGFGAAMGRGCTSGHGIVGNSRLSVRSMVYTVTFMMAGACSATFGRTNEALGVNSGINVLARGASTPSDESAALWMKIAVASVAAFAATSYYIDHHLRKAGSDGKGSVAHPPQSKKHTIDVLVDSLAGFVFGVGLVISGMMSPAKVSGFLSVTESSFDPSLMFVMGGAMALTAPGIRYIKAHTGVHRPKCAYNEFDFPKNSKVDQNLLLGGILFGTGWGLAGVCPGPAIVSAVVNPSIEIAAWLGAFLFGMYAHENLVA